MTTLDNCYGKMTMNNTNNDTKDVFSGSYLPSDVQFLLTRLNKTDVENVDPTQKETLIQSGQRHYSQMLTLETPVSEAHHAIYQETLARYLLRTAGGIHRLASTLFDTFKNKGETLVLVSLVRAGVPIGVLLKRAFDDPNAHYHRPAVHYGISIIRDKGIDHLALEHITQNHPNCPIVFVDGWTGKGAIFRELRRSLQRFCQARPHTYAQIFHQSHYTVPLVVLADPAHVAWLSDSEEDWLIPSSILNSTISGLVSRTLYANGAFHGCVYYDEFADIDESLNFVNQVDASRKTLHYPYILPKKYLPKTLEFCPFDFVMDFKFDITDSNLIKPSIAEATRAIMRRMPKCVLINKDSKDNQDTKLLRHLCEQRNIPITYDNIQPYQAVTIIQKRR